MIDVMAAWSMTHGLADLMISGKLKPLQSMSRAQREAVVTELIRRAITGAGAT